MVTYLKGFELAGFERPVTRVRFNADCDLLFGSSVDRKILNWRGDDFEPLSYYDGHVGAINDISIRYDSTQFISGSGDGFLKIWDTETTKEVSSIVGDSAILISQISFCHDKILLVKISPRNRFILSIYAYKEPHQLLDEYEDEGYPLCGVWGYMDQSILLGLASGELFIYDISNKTSKRPILHKSKVSDIQLSCDFLQFITCSDDGTVIISDSETFKPLIKYNVGVGLKSVSLSPFKHYFICSGGVESRDVTTAKSNIMDILFFDVKRKNLMAKLDNPHQGTVNTLRIRPDGRGMASGAEDSSMNSYLFDETSIFVS